VSFQRRYALGGLFVLAGAVTAVLLASVVGTVFLAITVAYLLWPVRRALVARGWGPRAASAAVTVGALVGTVLLLVPLAIVAYVRFDSFVALIELLPPEFVVGALGFEYVVTLEAVSTFAIRFVERAARRAAATAPVLVLKTTLFVFLVYSLLFYAEEAQKATLALVPSSYRGVAAALNRRARETLLAIYVLQAATAFGTFVLAVPTFLALGYGNAVTLSTVAALLQFIPIIGPSVLLGGLAIYHAAVGQLLQGVLVAVVGGFVIALLPDVLIRPRLARRTADIPGSLYFVGFFGGVLTLGPIGVVAGPLAVGLFVEVASLLSAELNPTALDDTPADAESTTDPDTPSSSEPGDAPDGRE
jgi:predicted PurR-regulated permease PerM